MQVNFIQPSYNIWGETPSDYSESVKWIEACGRICYKSEDRITETSAEKFVGNVCKSGHYSVIEHSNFVVEIDVPLSDYVGVYNKIIERFQHRLAYHTIALVHVGSHEDGIMRIQVNGNIRSWYETYETIISNRDIFQPFLKEYGDLFLIDDGKKNDNSPWYPVKQCNIFNELKRITVMCTIDRGITHEFVRHRPCSFSQESTRYVNYNNKGFDVIIPSWLDINPGEYSINNLASKAKNQETYDYMLSIYESLDSYNKLVDKEKGHGWIAGRGRAVLPNSIKADIAITADLAEWEHIFNLRCAPGAHEQFRQISIPMLCDFYKIYPDIFKTVYNKYIEGKEDSIN